MRFFHVVLMPALGLVCLGLAACPQEAPEAEGSVGCRLNSDCASGQVCAEGQCVDSAACAGLDCPCASDSDCPGDLLCDLDSGECFTPRCFEDRGCELGQVCLGGRCETDVEADRDRDGVPDGVDLCPELADAEQEDNDTDGQGDLCDLDDDNDAVPDTLDSCPFAFNLLQRDANADGVGNVCDAQVGGTTLTGAVDFSAGGNPDTNDALVFVTGVDAPVGIAPDGRFVLPEAVVEVERVGLRVQWPGFIAADRTFEVPDVLSHDVGVIALQPEAAGDEAVAMVGQARLQGRASHFGILVKALVGGVPVASTLTDEQGAFVLSASRLDHTLEVSQRGFGTEAREVIFSAARQTFLLGGEPLDQTPILLDPLRDAALIARISSPIEGVDLSRAAVVLVDEVARRVLGVEPDGTFSQDDLSPGLYGLEIDLAGHEPLRRFVALDSGANDLGRLEVVPIEVPLRARVVTVVQGVEQGLEGVSVRLRRDDRLVASTLSDERGELIFEALPVTHDLSMSKANFLPLSATVEFDGQGFTRDGQRLDGDEVAFVMVRSPQSDQDSDGVIDALDNCPQAFNNDQRDVDGDRAGDACDGDADGDGMVNGLDNCPFSPNPMQEDFDGLGRGAACTLGTIERPIEVGCGLRRQHLDTRERAGRLRGSCGGGDAPEVIYSLGVNDGEVWSVEVEGDFAQAIYLLDPAGREVDCIIGGRARFGGEGFAGGNHLLVVDGFGGADAAGAIEVTIQSTQACSTSFLTQRALPVGDEPRSVALGDVNGDGLLDIVAANVLGDDVSVLSGRGGGEFEPQRAFDVGDGPFDLALGDVNGDGLPDIITANSASDNVSVLLGDGDGSFDPQRNFEAGDGPLALALGDVNGDGLADITTANNDGDNVSVLLGRSGGDFGPQRAFVVGDGPFDVALGDVNGDGVADIITANIDGGNVSVLLGDGDGGFEPHYTLNVRFGPSEVTLGDVNGDGLPDIITANFSDDVSVLLGMGGGEFEAQRVFDVGRRPRSVALDDVNGDGLLDILTANEVSNDVSVLLGRGAGNFEPLQGTLRVGDRPFSMALGEVNGDGLLDITTANLNSDDVSVLLGTGDGFFGPHRAFNAEGGRARKVTLGDVNDDGLLDIVTANANIDNVSVLLGRAGGAFEPQRTYEAGDEPFSVALGDVNGDGLLDIITANNIGDDVSVLPGDGSGGFGPQRAFVVGDGPFDVALGDVNGDGFPDIITADGDGDGMSVLLSLGGGDFEPRRDFDVGDQPRSATLGDVNGDGLLDILTANFRSNTVSVLLGLGGGDFEPQRTFAVGTFPNSVALGDVDGDGLPDLIISNGNSGNVSVLLGNGDGSFAPQRTFGAGLGPIAGALGDVDRDGLLDIITATTGGDDVGVLLGNGDGTFEPRRAFKVGDFPLSMALGDVNRDGFTDILTTNSDVGVSVLLTRSRFSVDRDATRLAQSTAPPCPPTAILLETPGAFLARPGALCSVARLDLDLSFDSDARGALALTSPLGVEVRLGSLPDLDRPPGLARPEIVAPLARFETHPLGGRWALEAEGVRVDSARMVVNTFPDDPFAPDTLADACTPDLDQPAEPDFVCRLEGGAIEGALLEDAQDEDVFLLQGDFGGAFIQGQTLTLTIEVDRDDVEIEAQLRAFGARGPRAVAEAIGSGLWSLSFTVRPEFSRRYFALHVRGQGSRAARYDLSLSTAIND